MVAKWITRLASLVKQEMGPSFNSIIMQYTMGFQLNIDQNRLASRGENKPITLKCSSIYLMLIGGRSLNYPM